MEKILFFITMMLVLSCKSSPDLDRGHPGIDNTPVKVDTIFFSDSVSLKFKFLNEKNYVLLWGEKLYENESNDTLSLLPSGALNLEWENSHFLCLRQGCGTNCYFSYVLPLTKGAKEQFYMYPYSYEKRMGLIAYNGNQDSVLLLVTNLNTEETVGIMNDFHKGSIIDSIGFIGKDSIYVKWEEPDGLQRYSLFEIAF